MFTRQQYLDNECTHSQYYGQFVNDYTKRMVLSFIGLDAIKRSTDPYFNDIQLHNWDVIAPTFNYTSKLKECGDGFSLATGVCIAKEAARQIKNADLTSSLL